MATELGVDADKIERALQKFLVLIGAFKCWMIMSYRLDVQRSLMIMRTILASLQQPLKQPEMPGQIGDSLLSFSRIDLLERGTCLKILFKS